MGWKKMMSEQLWGKDPVEADKKSSKHFLNSIKNGGLYLFDKKPETLEKAKRDFERFKNLESTNWSNTTPETLGFRVASGTPAPTGLQIAEQRARERGERPLYPQTPLYDNRMVHGTITETHGYGYTPDGRVNSEHVYLRDTVDSNGVTTHYEEKFVQEDSAKVEITYGNGQKDSAKTNDYWPTADLQL